MSCSVCLKVSDEIVSAGKHLQPKAFLNVVVELAEVDCPIFENYDSLAFSDFCVFSVVALVGDS